MAKVGFGIKRLTPDTRDFPSKSNPQPSINQLQPNAQAEIPTNQTPQSNIGKGGAMQQLSNLSKNQVPNNMISNSIIEPRNPTQLVGQQTQQFPSNPYPITQSNPNTAAKNPYPQQNAASGIQQANTAQPFQQRTLQNPQNVLNRSFNKEDVAKKAAEIHQAAMLRQQKMKFMKSFIELKRKIYQLIELGKPEEARDTYDNLFLLYQEMAKNVKAQDIISIKTDISVVYHNLEQALNKKRIKKGVFKEVEVNKHEAEKIYRDKIVTTDLDSIMQIVEEKGKINLAEIEAKFNVPRKLAEEWIQILADYGLVEIKYLPIGGIEITKITQ